MSSIAVLKIYILTWSFLHTCIRVSGRSNNISHNCNRILDTTSFFALPPFFFIRSRLQSPQAVVYFVSNQRISRWNQNLFGSFISCNFTFISFTRVYMFLTLTWSIYISSFRVGSVETFLPYKESSFTIRNSKLLITTTANSYLLRSYARILFYRQIDT